MTPATSRYHAQDLRKGRWSQPGGLYLVTSVTVNRIPWFDNHNHARICARTLHAMPAQGLVANLAWVIMPDHIHWLLALQAKNLAYLLKAFKARVAHGVNTATGRQGPLWQRGYHDHALRAEEDAKSVARYIIANPIRAGLCRRVGDYPYWYASWL